MGRREAWIGQLIKAQATSQNISKKSIWKCMRSTEKICNNARMIKHALLGLAAHQGLNHVIRPNSQDNTIHIKSNTKLELEQLCLSEARQCFTQASTMPFLMSSLVEIFTEVNLFTQAFDQVLEGNFKCLPNIDHFVRHLIQALKRLENITTIPNRQLDEITLGWRKAWAVTSSSPLALHFGHYMAGTFNPTIAIFNA